jgi:hypothetical protein
VQIIPSFQTGPTFNQTELSEGADAAARRTDPPREDRRARGEAFFFLKQHNPSRLDPLTGEFDRHFLVGCPPTYDTFEDAPGPNALSTEPHGCSLFETTATD